MSKKTFKGFNNKQTHQLLQESGYTGPAQKDDMDKFLASSPKAAAQIGRYAEIARLRVEGQSLAKTGLAKGGKAVPRKTEIAGQPHMLAYINPEEEKALRQMGGSGDPGPGGVPSYAAPAADQLKSGFSYDERRYLSVPTQRANQPEGVRYTGPVREGRFVYPGDPLYDQATAAGRPGTDPGLFGRPDLYNDDNYAGTGGPAPSGSDIRIGDTGDRRVSTIKPKPGDPDYVEPTAELSTTPLPGVTPTKPPVIQKGTVTPEVTENAKLLDDAQVDAANASSSLADLQKYASGKSLDDIYQGPSGDTENGMTIGAALEAKEINVTRASATVNSRQQAFDLTDIPSTAEALGKAVSSPTSLLTKPTVYGLDVSNGQLIDTTTGQLVDAAALFVKQADAGESIDDPVVKATLSYIENLSDEERASKYPPYAGYLSKPLTDKERNDLGDYYTKQQAQVAMDAKIASTSTYEAVVGQAKVKLALADLAAATGTPTDDALMTAESMNPEDLAQLGLSAETLDVIRQIPEIKIKLESGETPEAALFDEYTASEAVTSEGVGDVKEAKFETDTPKAEAEVDYSMTPTAVVEAETTAVKEAAQFDTYATAEEKQSEFIPDVVAEETNVDSKEVVDVNKVINSEEIIVTAKVLEALNEASTAKAATVTFSQQLEAKLVKGEVSARSTVQGQMEKLMEGFNDGTPAWAAGALRKVNAAMAARGMGASSMAGAAMIQAAMESAIPIAQADASIFANMDIENMRNEQNVALANAAASQGFALANLDNEQATRIQNSMNNANLQLTNLSNEQEAVLAMAGFKASLQGQELSISANVALANAARYASVNDINLTNRQQSSILKSTQNLDVEMANLSNTQQTALSNLQVQAAMQGQDLTNEQQMAVLESTQLFEVSMGDATRKQAAFMQDAVARAAMDGRVLDNKQQTALFNISNEVAERGIELNNEQQTTIFNMSNKLTIEVEELSGRQATALANAQIEAAMKGQELTNKQQVNVITAERIAEVANMNFTAEQSRVIQNSNLAQTVDLANLSNEQAKLMADVASMASVDMANLDNRQQAAAQQAQAFLGMEMSNLDNEQQATMFEAQSLVQSIFSDQAAENAGLQFNAESINQVNQFYDSMTTSVNQFNKAQENAMEQFNTGEENTMTKFQAELDNQRDMFNSSNELVIAQANTVWRQSVATINTAQLNEANMEEVRTANGLTMQALNELWQQERDLMSMAWDGANNVMDRDSAIAVQSLKNVGTAATSASESDDALSAVSGTIFTKIISKIFNLP